MADFRFLQCELKDAFIIDNFYMEDNRGEFTKLFEKRMFEESGITFDLNETFVSISAKNVIRGLHFQTHNPQAKLVSVLKGSAWDVIVDLRPESVSFKKWKAVELSAENHRGVYVPRGFAHGFAALEDETMMLYQCDGAYDRESDGGIRFDDKDINITWPLDESKIICSERDLKLEGFSEYMRHSL